MVDRFYFTIEAVLLSYMCIMLTLLVILNVR